MKAITIDSVKQNGWLVFEVITGSKAYGLDNAKSDTDIKGVFVLPKEIYYGLNYVEQVNNESNDIVYYELKRFVELLAKNNPNILEMLSVPEHCILFKDTLMNEFTSQLFLSKLCEKTFANYAFTQIKKAYGLEKKILNPVEVERKRVLDFCFIYREKDAVPLVQYLQENNIEQSKVGLTAIAHLRDCYNIYYSSNIEYGGVTKSDNSNDVHLSSIPKGEQPIAMLYFNKDAYSVYCKKYKEYWDWVEKRNDERYKNTLSHGKNYDAKNMLHVFRLLNMAKEIATENNINVHRKDRAFLLSIKAGEFEYDALVNMAAKLKDELPVLFQHSNLQDEPDIELIEKLLINTREQFYLKQTK
jgi:uncharacterized protein